MNKTQLIAAIANQTELSLAKSEKTVAAILQIITEALTKGDTITLTGFGNFGVKKRAARNVRNPRTGVEMMIKAAIVPYFKAGKNLKEEVDSQES